MKIILVIGSIFCMIKVDAQYTNNGAKIIVDPGGSITCQGDLTNTSGSITNNGRIYIQGGFYNQSLYNTTTNDDSLIFTGNHFAGINTGAAAVRNIVINKDAGSPAVQLFNTLQITGRLDLLSGSISTGLPLLPWKVEANSAVPFNIASGSYITGQVKRTGWLNNNTVVFNDANLQVVTRNGTAPSDITAIMLPNGDPANNEREVKRTFFFIAPDGDGFTSDIRFPYNISELNTNDETRIVPWANKPGGWTARMSPITRNSSQHWVSTTGIGRADLYEWKLADPRYQFILNANLAGAWNGTDMNTSLTSVIPLAQPFNTPPFNYSGTEAATAIPPNVVDWVMVELRKPGTGQAGDANSSTIIGRKPGFLLKDGTVVSTNGTTPVSFDIPQQGNAFVVLRHRNHLGVMSNTLAGDAIGNFTNDFTVISKVYKSPDAATNPVVLLNGTKYGLWAGDANGNGMVNITDVNAVKLAIGSSGFGYEKTDTNLDANVNVTDVNLVKLVISASATGSTMRESNTVLRTSIPN